MRTYPARLSTPAPPPGILVAGHYRNPYGYNCYRPSGTKDWLVIYTVAGVGVAATEYQRHSCKTGDLVLLPPGTPHDYQTADLAQNEWETLWAHFIPRSSWVEWLPKQKKPRSFHHVYFSSPLTRDRIVSAMKRLILDSRHIGQLYHEELGLNALEEIVLLMANQQSDEDYSSLDPRIQKVLDYLTQAITKDHSVNDLAEQVRLSPSRLAHLFKEQVGDSIIEFLLKMRLRQAARLLEFTTKTVTEIALDVGFQSPDYFTRRFSKHFGVNPMKYRKIKINRDDRQL